ncbi:beta-hexosaminidase-like [Haliotis cracherodii]|uniref:beta-hexosaminidase-like n=1 Tax=Haliotis cracherodii TaxID=6455 RepID=UPI0039E89225
MDQSLLNTFADTLDIRYSVLDNLSDGRGAYRGSIHITNTSSSQLGYGKWGIYFCHLRMMEPDFMPVSDSHVYEDVKMQVKHINGCLFILEPVKGFATLKTGQTIEIQFKAQYYSVAKTDVFPNWYLTSEGLEPRLIKSTVGESLEFVSSFDTPSKWKRFDYELSNGQRRTDLYDPWSAEFRFKNNEANTGGGEPDVKLIVPTPYQLEVRPGDPVNLLEPGWIVWSHDQVRDEARYLSESLGLNLVECSEAEVAGRDRTVLVMLGSVAPPDPKCADNQEAYSLDIGSKCVRLLAPTSAGIFYAGRSLLSLRSSDGTLPLVSVVDFPRFQYRGMHVDVSRNFHTKDEVVALLEVMGCYKLNRLHLHLTDDEGWRLQIPGLEELTQVGGRRGHDLEEKQFLLPVLGSGPAPDLYPGSGFYTVQDYREILKEAAHRHIEVIPEIDVPGHSHAAIVAMAARCRRLRKEGRSEEEVCQYLLSDIENPFKVQSVQMFSDNVLDPGRESTYTFIDKIVKEVKAMHEGVSPLKMFHLGGDEVPYKAWLESPACQARITAGEVSSVTELMGYFVKRVAQIVKSHGLDVAAWQDGIVMKKTELFDRSDFDNDSVVVYAWKNVWETGMASDTVKLANAGYQVVMSQATHLYFDHPYEPHPEERGLYWSGRYLDTHKVFSFMPDTLYANADRKMTGEPFTEAELKKLSLENECMLTRPENIIGLQGQLWSELVRTPGQLQEMITPRIIALAERAWHKASWEDVTDRSQLEVLRQKDWADFASTLGSKELHTLEDMNITYYLPPPGVRLLEAGRVMTANCAYPGLPIYYSWDGRSTWHRYSQPVDVPSDSTAVTLITRSFNGQRSSREVTVSLLKP